MFTTIGLFDIYTDKDEQSARYDMDTSVMKLYGHAISKEYDRLMQRLITQVDITMRGTREWYRVNAIWDTGSMTTC